MKRQPTNGSGSASLPAGFGTCRISSSHSPSGLGQWRGASDSSDLDVVACFGLGLGDEPAWDAVQLPRVFHEMSLEVGLEVSQIWYAPDLLPEIWTRDEELLIWRRDLAEGIRLVGEPSDVLGERACSVLSEPLSPAAARAIGARRLRYRLAGLDDDDWGTSLTDLNRRLGIAAGTAAHAVSYVLTGHNERRPIDGILDDVAARISVTLDPVLRMAVLGACELAPAMARRRCAASHASAGRRRSAARSGAAARAARRAPGSRRAGDRINEEASW